jgi:hypothetical protein
VTTVARVPDDRFRIFVSHKHSDAKLAKVVQDQIEALSPTFECWVSGEDISSGSDWNRSITVALGRSHLLLLLFTAPSSNWDWCLYEAGLFIQFASAANEDVRSVVSVYDPAGGAPRPLAGVQGVPAEPASVAKFLTRLCTEPWEISDDWRRGPIDTDVSQSAITSAADAVVAGFADALAAYKEPATDIYFPCHRIVLDADAADVETGIPEDAWVVVGDGATSGFTLSLFGLAPGDAPHSWADLLDRIEGHDAPWRSEIDAAVVAASHERLFVPGQATMAAWDRNGADRREYHPVLYSISRRPRGEQMRAEIVVVLDPLPAAGRVAGARPS